MLKVLIEPEAVSARSGAGTISMNSSLTQEERQRRERVYHVSRATSEFAVDALLHVFKSVPGSSSGQGASQDPEETRRQMVIRQLPRKEPWTQERIEEHLSVLLGRCDVASRSSPCTDQRVTRHNHILSDAKRCKVMYQATMDAFDNMIDGSSLLGDYGQRLSWKEECDRLRMSFKEAIRMRNGLLQLVGKHSLLSRSGIPGSHDYPDTVLEAVQILRKRLSNDGNTSLSDTIRSRFWAIVVKCSNMMSCANRELQSFECRVKQHVHTRSKRGDQFFSYNFLGEDMILTICEFVGYNHIPQVLALNKAFSCDESIKGMLPHLSVRCVPGLFPHGNKFIPGIGHCSIVSKNTQVCVVVDMAITGAKKEGILYCPYQYARANSDGWPEDLIGANTIREERRARCADTQERNMRTFDEEPRSKDRFRMRLSARRLFCGELRCSVSLVYADTHEEVHPDSLNAVISIPRRMALRANTMTTYTARDGAPYPAYTTLNVMHLSTNHLNRLYKFRVVAKGCYTNVDGGRQSQAKKTLVGYSAPFAVVSTKRAFKRKRQSELQLV